MEQNSANKNRTLVWTLLLATATVLLASPGSALDLASGDSRHTDDADTGCGNVGPLLAVGAEREGALDPATDAEDAVGLQVGPAWEEKGVELVIQAGRESAVGTYTLGVAVFGNTECTGTPVASTTVSYGQTVTLPFTVSGSTTRTVRIDVDEYGGSARLDGAKEGHCYPFCIIDWAVRYNVPTA